LEKVTIIGVGLIGGSLGLALKKSPTLDAEIVGFSRRSETVARALEHGIIDRGADSMKCAVEEADLVIIATPVMTIKEVLERISIDLTPGCIVTDTGSTKAKVMQWAEQYLPRNVSFIGGHPMAGKETSGIDDADADLFNGCTYCLSPAESTNQDAVQEFEGMIRSIGAKPFIIDAETHDSLVAGVSHLPMLLSAAFVSATTGSSSWAEMAKLAARGYRDLSRLASGSPEMNHDICVTNYEEIIHWIDRYMEEMKVYRRMLSEDADGLRNTLSRARDAREEWLGEEGC